MTLNSWDVEKIAALLRSAGTVALHWYEAPPAEWKEDRTVVTAADRAVEQLLAESFDAPEQGVWMIGEETVASRSEDYIQEALRSDCCFVVDPIDGTAPYTAQLPIWGISIGLLRRGVLCEGAVYLPVGDECLATHQGKILYRRLRRERDWHDFAPAPPPLGSGGHIAVGQMPAHKFVFDCSNQLFAWSSAVGSLFRLLQGRVTAYFGDFKLWDVAGMLPILRLAHFRTVMLGMQGRQLSCDLRDGGFQLERSSRERWKVVAPVIVAPDCAAVCKLMTHIHDTRISQS